MSCTSTKPSLHTFAAVEADALCRTAVLPFVNNSRFDQGELIVQRVFAAELADLQGVEVVGEGDVRAFYPELRIFPNQLPDLDQLRVLGSRLGVQSIISGRIVEMEERGTVNKVNPQIALSLQVHSGQSGETMWTSYYRREGEDYRTVMHYGQINTVTELARIMSNEILEKWLSEGVSGCGGQ